jgi:hypothetical protein
MKFYTDIRYPSSESLNVHFQVHVRDYVRVNVHVLCPCPSQCPFPCLCPCQNLVRLPLVLCNADML